MSDISVYGGVLVKTKDAFDTRLSELSGIVDGVHVDVADGKYVPNTLLNLHEIGALSGNYFEAHLMVEHPEKYFSLCKSVGFHCVIAHVDTLEDQSAEGLFKVQDQVHALGMKLCVAFKHDVDVDYDVSVLERLDKILIMTIELGFSGQPFLPAMLDKIRSVRAKSTNVVIEVDGHVDVETAPLIIESGANVLVSTSYLQGGYIVEKYNLLKNG